MKLGEEDESNIHRSVSSIQQLASFKGSALFFSSSALRFPWELYKHKSTKSYKLLGGAYLKSMGQTSSLSSSPALRQHAPAALPRATARHRPGPGGALPEPLLPFPIAEATPARVGGNAQDAAGRRTRPMASQQSSLLPEREQHGETLLGPGAHI
jgi:hypothetical protein